MAMLVNRGRAGLAAALKDRAIHIAWGRGMAWWGSTAIVQRTFGGTPQRITLDHAPITSVVVRDQAGSQVYAAGDDYTYDLQSGIVSRVNSGQIPAGATVQVEAVYGTPSVTADDTALVDEVGRRVASSVEFVVPDPDGSIVTPGGQRWTASTEATRYLFVSVLFDFLEAADEIIREVGLFVDTVRGAGVPVGRAYLVPADVATPGYLMMIDRPPALQRSPSDRKGYSYVMVI
ncbi:hypothetical protein CCR97_23395 [Rhodoplanes elegans]|uniref:DUF4815 domain-containing protein n=1 Tax=Rhodoplanes elegans TaxID=29408 RepID=A0A327KI71_9BRAD|nr:hypothetical protein [Rhodoplanes elegans]MBK5961127.1 hypothetical protein [Rhodoplanes elegans]RAI38157.1 hypothetical protein CH338_13645 [Rhodoplanes elegans]